MKHWLSVAIIAMSVLWLGCGTSTPAASGDFPVTSQQGEYMFVSLSVPNMT